MVWVFPVRYLLIRPGAGCPHRADPPWTYTFLIGWAGMRGVVTLAAAFLIPEGTEHREVLLLIAFTVVAGTLFLQGLTLPWVARLLKVPSPDPGRGRAGPGDAAAPGQPRPGSRCWRREEDDDPHGVRELDPAAAWSSATSRPGSSWATAPPSTRRRARPTHGSGSR